MMYAGRSVVITGASRGLGAHLARHFRAEGATVTELDRTHGVDIGDPDAVRLAMPESVDVLVNNAGVGHTAYAVTLTDKQAEETVRTNLLGTFYCSREAARRMRTRGGRIINIGSIHSRLQPVGASVYAATKAGAEAMTGALAKELARWQVTVNTVGLSPFMSDMFAQFPPAKREEFVQGLPIPRMATPEDVFNVVDFFASPASSFVTGQVVYLGGIR